MKYSQEILYDGWNLKNEMEGIVKKYLPYCVVKWSSNLIEHRGVCKEVTYHNLDNDERKKQMEITFSTWLLIFPDRYSALTTAFHEVAHGILKKDHCKEFYILLNNLLEENGIPTGISPSVFYVEDIEEIRNKYSNHKLKPIKGTERRNKNAHR